MDYSNRSLKAIKDKRISGEIARDEYWFEISRILHGFNELFSVQPGKVKSLEVGGGGLVLTYEVAPARLIKMIINPDDLRTAPLSILCEGNYEEFECSILLRIAEISGLFCDIGANIGFYTLACSVVNPNLRILSFEPNKSVVGSLTDNIELNSPEISTSNIRVIPTALGEFAKQNALFYVPKISGSGAGSLKNLHPDEGEALNFETDIQSLDSVLGGEFTMDLIKIDVEGFELSVLKGGLSSIERYKPTIFIELLRKWMKPYRAHPQDVIDLLSPIGYSCFAIGENILTNITKIDDDTIENNFIFVHPKRIEHLKLISEVTKS
jgi:FkbM family methyltransferase